jgi:hypothetical protein
MKELPIELWTKVAKELKREPPPAGTKANWNDHFHQQDLVSLQRVSKVCRTPLRGYTMLMNLGAV